jgi:hypothetical protein
VKEQTRGRSQPPHLRSGSFEQEMIWWPAAFWFLQSAKAPSCFRLRRLVLPAASRRLIQLFFWLKKQLAELETRATLHAPTSYVCYCTVTNPRCPRCLGFELEIYPPPLLKCVIFGAGGFGYFLTDSRYSSTDLSAGPDTQPKSPPTTILVRVHLDVVCLRIAGHRRAGRGRAGISKTHAE